MRPLRKPLRPLRQITRRGGEVVPRPRHAFAFHPAGFALMKEAIRQRAFELGFDDCRFTTAAPPESASHLREWLAAGRHGEMSWLERNAPKRMNPQLVLPGARSVILLAISYATDPPPSALRPPHSGEVARYARFTDYHDVLAERLKSLTAIRE